MLPENKSRKGFFSMSEQKNVFVFFENTINQTQMKKEGSSPMLPKLTVFKKLKAAKATMDAEVDKINSVYEKSMIQDITQDPQDDSWDMKYNRVMTFKNKDDVLRTMLTIWEKPILKKKDLGAEKKMKK